MEGAVVTLDSWPRVLFERIERAVVEHGIPDVYDSTNAWLVDFGADLPWDLPTAQIVEKNLLAMEGFTELRQSFEEKFGQDPWPDLSKWGDDC